MNELIDAISRGYVSLIANLGLLSMLAWVLSYFGFNLLNLTQKGFWGESVKIGLLFGFAAALLINIPIEFSPGIIADARGAPILMSGIIGGPLAAIITGVMAGGMRAYIGGVGAPSGVAYVVIFSIVGVLWWWKKQQNSSHKFQSIALIGVATIATAISVPLIFTFPPQIQYKVLVGVWPQLWIANVAGVWMLSLLIGKEVERRAYEANLQEERIRASKASEAKAKFLAAMSHEIRTPLNGILGIIQLLLQEKHDVKTIDNLRVARESGLFLLGLLNQVLDFAKIESGKTVIQKQDFDVEALIDGLSSIFRFQLSSKDVDFKTNIYPSANTRFYGDLEHIRQVLFNLIGNASKFTKQGYVSVSVEYEKENSVGWLQFCVTDTGPGIPSDRFSVIFNEFEQGNLNTKSEGTGLGLSIASGLVKDMGGEIWLESTVGLGTKFYFKVPVDPAKHAATVTIPDDAEIIVSRPLSILVAEDNAVNQMVVKGLLKKFGHSVVIAGNGQEAVDEMSNRPDAYDLVFMDIQMPVMDGIKATKTIRATRTISDDIPIVALTANAFVEQKQEYLDVGMNDVITKPIQVAEVNDVLVKFFGAAEDVRGQVPTVQDLTEDKVSQLCDTLGTESVLDIMQITRSSAEEIMSRVKGKEITGEEQEAAFHELKGMLSNFGFTYVVGLANTLRSIEKVEGKLPQNQVSKLEAALQASFNEALEVVNKKMGQDA